MALIWTLTVSTTAFERTKEKFFRQTDMILKDICELSYSWEEYAIPTK